MQLNAQGDNRYRNSGQALEFKRDNRYRNSGQALEFKLLNNHSCRAFKKGLEIQLQAAPSQDEFMYNNHQVKKAKLISQMKDTILKKYGNAVVVEEELPRELLLDQSEIEVEYDRAGRFIKAQF
ncbi:hypothetical protein FEM48_Zijuj06G0180800 [Ziziphus jujuba var. spinosa]|uniref:Pre-mRNA-splicing factor SLU7 n=1 Tax=Ziziphus jujuba var. spinosa TaxID=714518 RepID=A0A978VAT5_ZIZJJ|nr:hypothetical protein FEM48_Zijuj06G0180800 [Ziziphus jujuba var. spinosa]